MVCHRSERARLLSMLQSSGGLGRTTHVGFVPGAACQPTDRTAILQSGSPPDVWRPPKTTYDDGAAVDWRMISLGANIFLWTPRLPRRRSNINWIVNCPILSTGWAIAVMGGSI